MSRMEQEVRTKVQRDTWLNTVNTVLPGMQSGRQPGCPAVLEDAHLNHVKSIFFFPGPIILTPLASLASLASLTRH